MSSRKNYYDVLGGDDIDENGGPSLVFSAFAQPTLQPDSTAEQIANLVGNSESPDQLPMKPGAPRFEVVQPPKQFWRQPFNHLAVGPRNRTFPAGVRQHKNRNVPFHGRGILNHGNLISPSKVRDGFSGVHDERRGHNFPGVRNREDRYHNENHGELLSGNGRPNDLSSTNSHTNNDEYPRNRVEGHKGSGFHSRSQRRRWYYHSFVKHRNSGKDGSDHKSRNPEGTRAVSNNGGGTGGSGSCICSDGIQVAGVDREVRVVRPFNRVLGRRVHRGSPFRRPRETGFESETKPDTNTRGTEGSQIYAQLQATVDMLAVAFKRDMLKWLSEQDLHPVLDATGSDVTDREMTLDEYAPILSDKRKSIVANKVEERKAEMDKTFQSMQLIDRKNVDETFVRLGFEKKKKKRNARGKDQKFKKSEIINELVKPVEVDMFHESSRARERTHRRGGGSDGSAVRRDRSFGFYARGQYGDNAQQLRAPQIEDLSQSPFTPRVSSTSDIAEDI